MHPTRRHTVQPLIHRRRELHMAEPIRQRRFQLVPTSSAIRRIRPRNHPSPLRQLHITDSQIQRHRQHRRLHSRRTRRQLVQNRYPPPPATNSFAHAGASNATPCSRTTGNPAKSDGSRNDPNTVLHNTHPPQPTHEPNSTCPYPDPKSTTTAHPPAHSHPTQSQQ